jgi:hypothetical protein
MPLDPETCSSHYKPKDCGGIGLLLLGAFEAMENLHSAEAMELASSDGNHFDNWVEGILGRRVLQSD